MQSSANINVNNARKRERAFLFANYAYLVIISCQILLLQKWLFISVMKSNGSLKVCFSMTAPQEAVCVHAFI